MFANGVKELASASFAIRVESDQPILAERAVYWSSGGIIFVEGHNTAGVTAEASKWAFAEGREGRFEESGLLSHDTYFLFSNSGAQALRVKGTFLREDGTGLVRTFTINPASRYTLLTGQFAELGNQRFAAFFEAVDANDQPITTQTFVAERAVYWGDGYFGGHASTGTPWTGTVATPAVAPTAPVVTSITPAHGALAGGTDVVVRGSNFFESRRRSSIGTLGQPGERRRAELHDNPSDDTSGPVGRRARRLRRQPAAQHAHMPLPARSPTIRRRGPIP